MTRTVRGQRGAKQSISSVFSPESYTHKEISAIMLPPAMLFIAAALLCSLVASSDVRHNASVLSDASASSTKATGRYLYNKTTILIQVS